MYGHEMVSRDLTRRLKARLPERLNSIRLQRQATLLALPDPHKVLPYFLPDIDIDGYPTVCVTELDTPNGITGAQEIRRGTRFDSYVYRYPFRIWVYLRSVDYGITELMLKRYLLAVREVILEDLVLTDNDEAYVVFEPDTLSENFDSPMEDERRQVLGVGFIGVVLESVEIINLAREDPRAQLPLDVDGTVTALDRFTDQPTGKPSTIPESTP